VCAGWGAGEVTVEPGRPTSGGRPGAGTGKPHPAGLVRAGGVGFHREQGSRHGAGAPVVVIGWCRRSGADYSVATVIFATPTSISSWTASVLKVWFSSAAASGLMCTVVPSRTAFEPSICRGFRLPP